MDSLQSPPPSEPKICYNKNCIVECDPQTLLLPSLVFFSVCQVSHGKWLLTLPSLVRSTTRHLWSGAFPMLRWEQAGWVMAGEIGVLASPWLTWNPARTPSLTYPLQPWDGGWASRFSSFSVWNSSVCTTRFKSICLGRMTVLQRKLCWNLHPKAHEVPSTWNTLHRLETYPCKCLPI